MKLTYTPSGGPVAHSNTGVLRAHTTGKVQPHRGAVFAQAIDVLANVFGDVTRCTTFAGVDVFDREAMLYRSVLVGAVFQSKLSGNAQQASARTGMARVNLIRVEPTHLNRIEKTATQELVSTKKPSAATALSTSTAVMGTKDCLPFAPANQISTLLPSLVSAAIVIIGWFEVNKAQANRDRRKQIREYVAGLRDDLDAIEKLVINYHTSQRVMAVEHEIISKLGRFEKACASMPRLLESQSVALAMKKCSLKANDEHLQQLRKAMTLNHFADEHSSALSVGHQLIQGIEVAAELVQDDFEDVRIAALD